MILDATAAGVSKAAGTTVDEQLTAAVEVLAGAGRVVVACHLNPDGDALGSALGLALALRARGVDVCAGFGTTDGEGVPGNLDFLPGQELLLTQAQLEDPPKLDVLVTVDTGSADRLGPLQRLLQDAPRTLVIDHHASNTGFGSDLLLDVSAASTTVLIARLVDALGVDLDAEIATCLYVGLVTDTGQFQFSATTDGVHELAARLLRAGVDPEPIGRALYGTTPFAAVKLEGLALNRAVLEPSTGGVPSLVWTWIELAEREAAGVPLAEVEGIIDSIRIAAEAEVAVVLKGIGPDEWMVSTRSKGSADVGRACVSLGGGGHRYAAGVTLTGSCEAVLDQLRLALASTALTSP